MTISEKSARLLGLAEGLKLDTESAEGKLISELIDLVREMATTIETVDAEVTELSEYIDEIDSDLCDVEEIVYDSDDDDDEYEYGEYDDDDDDECDGECEGCHGCDDLDDLDDDDTVIDITEEGMRCIMCDNCGDTVCFEETLDPSTLVCPGCGKPLVSKEDTENNE